MGHARNAEMKQRQVVTLLAITSLLCCCNLPTTFACDALNPYVGQICWVAFNIVPRGWALCNGQILSINSNAALFTVLGTTYGGDGTTTFALPNMQGRIPVGVGQLSGGSVYYQGQTDGSETVSLTAGNIPAHTHTTTLLQEASGAPVTASPPNTGVVVPTETGGSKTFALRTSATGAGIPHNNLQPYTTLNCIISLVGVFPPRQ